MEDNKLLASFQQEITTAWSFPERGKWATHNPKYRGNFAPQIPRNIILKYSNEGDFVLDPMVGAGTTLIEAKLLHRNADGIDINPEAVQISQKALEFEYKTKSKQNVLVGDARNLFRKPKKDENKSRIKYSSFNELFAM
ncbi:MAG: site-specific DNA-methyltransferase [Bacteroidetes bacterium]|nr:site-specific DNA-methyltransferase [Bacteroidota bacterium]